MNWSALAHAAIGLIVLMNTTMLVCKFMSSATPAMLAQHIRVAQRRLGNNPEEAGARFVQSEHDPRFTAYLNKQVRHLREALPLIWHLYERASAAGDAVLVVDLRARDLEIPEEVELMSVY